MSHLRPGLVCPGLVSLFYLGYELLKAEVLANFQGPRHNDWLLDDCGVMVTRADLGGCLVSPKFLFLSLHRSGAPHSLDEGGGGWLECVEMQVTPLYPHGVEACQFSPRRSLVGSCTQGGGLEGLAHVADEKLPDF